MQEKVRKSLFRFVVLLSCVPVMLFCFYSLCALHPLLFPPITTQILPPPHSINTFTDMHVAIQLANIIEDQLVVV